MSETFSIVSTRILAGPDMQLLEGAHLTVKDGRIASLGAGDPPPGGTTVDGRDLVLCPGFINAHTHIGDIVSKESGFGQPSWDVVMPPDGVKIRVLRDAADDAVVAAIRDAVRVMLSSGTTTFADFREGGEHGVGLLDRACEGTGVRVLAFGRHATHPPHSEDDLENNRGGLSSELVAELNHMLDTLPAWSVPLAFDVTDEGLRQTAELVRARGKLLATHCVETDRYRQICQRRFGDGDVERVVKFLKPDHIVHMTGGNEAEFALVAEAGIPVVVAPRMQSVMGIGLPPVDRMVAAGMTVALGSDNGMLASPNLLREMEYLSRALRASRHDPTFPEPAQLLQMATLNGARALGLADELGSLEVGKRADVVAFDGTTPNLRPFRDPIASIVNRAEAADVRCTMIDGRVVHGAW